MKLRIFLLLLIIPIFGCNPADPDDDGKDIPLVFTSVQAARDTIFTEDTTRISAKASGYKIRYIWYVEKGDLLGSGSEVTFVATPCTVGKNIIYCTVKDGNDVEETKQTTVTVL